MRPSRRFVALCRVAFALLLVTVLAAPVQSQELQERLQEAAGLLQQNSADAAGQALEMLDGIIEESEEYWPAHHYRGIALGQLGRVEEALAAFQRATELNPAFADAHRFAAISAANLGNFELAWEEGILAHQSGADMTQFFQQLEQTSEAPADLEERLNVARVFVAQMDLTDAEQNQDLRDALTQMQAELVTVQQELTKAFQESEEFALVTQQEAAQYVAQIKVQEVDLDENNPNRSTIDGDIKLLTPDGEQAWRRRLQLGSLRIADLSSQFRQLMVFMEEFLAEQADR